MSVSRLFRIAVIWVATPCGLVNGHHCLGGTHHLHFPLTVEAVCSSETLVSPKRLHFATGQNTVMQINVFL
jgi:hypothetical protein